MLSTVNDRTDSGPAEQPSAANSPLNWKSQLNIGSPGRQAPVRASKPLAVCQHSGGLPAQSLGQRLVNRAPNLFPLIPQTHSWTTFPHSLAAKRGREEIQVMECGWERWSHSRAAPCRSLCVSVFFYFLAICR